MKRLMQWLMDAMLAIIGVVVFTSCSNSDNPEIPLGKTNNQMTPVGIMHPLTAFGVKPNPGTTMPYIDVKPTTYACDEDRMVDILKNCDMSLVIKVTE